jgi:hypothetical protein
MEPLWTRGVPRQAPKEEVKLISTFIPDLLREETRRLFPQAPWLPATTAAALVNPGPAGAKPFTEEEAKEAIDLEADEPMKTVPKESKRKKRARLFLGQESNHNDTQEPGTKGGLK